jgi:hypothetical protein
LRSLQEVQLDFVEEARPRLGCGAKERRKKKKKKKFQKSSSESERTRGPNQNLLLLCHLVYLHFVSWRLFA